MRAGDVGMPGAFRDIIHQFAGHGDFRFGRLAQGDADGVAQSVGQQGADAHGGLDASVLAVARFGHAQVQGEVHPLALHRVCQQAHGAHHHHRVRCLDGDDHILEVLVHADAQELHTRLHHAFGRVAVAGHDAVRQRAVVHADADGRVVLLADAEEGDKAVAYLL